MTATYSVKQNQSVVDVALQLYGNLDSLVTLCISNGLTLTQELAMGLTVQYDKAAQQQSAVAAFLALNKVSIVSGGDSLPTGFDYTLDLVLD